MAALWASCSASPWLRLSQGVSFPVWFLDRACRLAATVCLPFLVLLATPVSSRFLPCLLPQRPCRLAPGRLLPGVDKRPRRTVATFPPGCPLGDHAPVGCHHDKPNCRRCTSPRRPRPRICLRKGCGRKYRPRRWNQRYCQVPECRRLLRRWQAAQRQTKRRRDAVVKTQHAQAQHARRQRAKSASQIPKNTEVVAARGHAARVFFHPPFCARPGCYEPPLQSIRNPARFCCAACRQAVRHVRDRERKWLRRDTLSGRRKRAYEYEAARRQRSRGQGDASGETPARAPPQ